MSNFRTEITPRGSDFKINYTKPILTIGSCFADTMGRKLSENKFDVCTNPFGTVYNPISIHTLLSKSSQRLIAFEDSYLQNQGLYFNYHFHSHFHAPNQRDLDFKIKSSIECVNDFLKKSNVIIITYGTALVYVRSDTHEIVANCHKMPASLFTKSLLSVEEIVASFRSLYDDIQSRSSIEKIILTVSPVRHLKDSLELNGVSKSILRTSCHELASQFEKVAYFPSFEIMMDDLRDYRFYKDDLIHPTEMAEDYLWGKFFHTYFDKPTQDLVNRWSEIRKALDHRPFYPESSSYKTFVQSILLQLEELKPFMNVDTEIHHLQSQIQKTSPTR